MSIGEDPIGSAPIAGSSSSYYSQLLSLVTTGTLALKKQLAISFDLNHIVSTSPTITFLKSLSTFITSTPVVTSTRYLVTTLKKTVAINIQLNSIRNLVANLSLIVSNSVTLHKMLLIDFTVTSIHSISEVIEKARVNFRRIFDFAVSFDIESVGYPVTVNENIEVWLDEENTTILNQPEETLTIYLRENIQ